MSSKSTASSPQNNEDRVTGLRLDIRRAIYQGSKLELGCPGESKCDLFARRQLDACQTCPKHLKPVEEEPNPLALRRIRLLLWLEGIMGVGCHFPPQDLSVSLWEGLADLKSERNRMERLLFEQKHQRQEQDRQQKAAIGDARKQAGIPGEGESFFKKPLTSKGRR